MRRERLQPIAWAVALVTCAGIVVVGPGSAAASAAVVRPVAAIPRACAMLTPADLTGSFGDSFAPGKARQATRTDTCTWAILPRKQLVEAALILTPLGDTHAARQRLNEVVKTKKKDGGRPEPVPGLGDAAFFTAPYRTKSGGINVSAIDARVGRVVLKLYYSPPHNPLDDDAATLLAALETVAGIVVRALR